MPPDTTGIVTAAHRRRELTRAKAIQALRELDRAGTPITFEIIARTASISRSWLYAQPDIRAEIQRLRAATQRTPSPKVPASQRASEGSAQTRLRVALERNRALAQDNQRLRQQLAHALGKQRRPPNHDPRRE
jgi:hypothetical protein